MGRPGAVRPEPPESDLVADEQAGQLLTLEAVPVGGERPVMQARVVYMGTLPTRSLSMRGRVFVEETEDPEGRGALVTKIVRDSGRQGYDFSMHDTRGRLVRARSVPDRAPFHPRIRGRPFAWVQHPDHIVRFDEMRTPDGGAEFLVVFDRIEDKRVMDAYAAMVRRARRTSHRQAEETMEGAAIRTM